MWKLKVGKITVGNVTTAPCLLYVDLYLLWMTGLHASCTSYQIENPDKLRSSKTCWDMSCFLMSCCAHAVLTCSQTHLDSWLLRTNCKNMKRTRLWRLMKDCKIKPPENPNLSSGKFLEIPSINWDCEAPLGCLESPNSFVICAGNRIASWVTASKYLAPTASSLCSATWFPRDIVGWHFRWGIQLFRI